jgi:beta-galactosidase
MNMKNLFIAISLLVAYQMVTAQNTPRQKVSINNKWKFHKGDYEDVIYKSFDDSHWKTVNIPHTWNALDILDDPPGYYRGISWYRKELTIGEQYKGKQVYIQFEGANQDAVVYLNGQEVGEHLGGYSTFNMDITKFIKFDEVNLLAVKLSNAHNEDLPPLGGDLCHFGGIYRDVYLVATDKVHFDLEFYGSEGIFITYPNITEKEASLNIWGRIANKGDKSGKYKIIHEVFDPEGNKVEEISSEIKLDAGKTGKFESTGKPISNPMLWSPENPELYVLKSKIINKNDKVIDELCSHFGFRWLSVDADKGFFMNDKKVFIKGVGKHQDFDKMGFAVSNESMVRDMELMDEMGANLVRGHYTFDPVVYDACDELGIMAITRLPVLDKVNFHEEFALNCERMMYEMIYQHFNRPSIIIWEPFNEVLGDLDWYWPKPQDPEKVQEHLKHAYKLSLRMEQLIRKTDPSRLTEHVFHTDPTPEYYKEAGLCNLSMINGWNLYVGWYHRSLDSVGYAMDLFREYNDTVAYVVSEYGAGSDPRLHTYEPTIYDFSIEAQDRFHKQYFMEAANRDWVAGLCMWTFVDFQVDGRQDAVPHINSKGLLRADRTPKDAYYLFKAYWSDNPTVHIASRDWTIRKEIVTGDVATRTITVYSNLDEIELLHNGKSLGKKATENHEAAWEVPFNEGLNQLEAIVKVDGKTLKDFLEIDFNFIPENTAEKGLPENGLSINVGQSRMYMIEEHSHNVWIPSKAYEKGNFGHKNGDYHRVWNNMSAWQGIREGVGHNMYGTGLDPVFQTFIKGVSEYQVDVPDGEYEVSLLFAEPFPKKVRLKPEEKTGADENGERVFDVSINNILLINDLNLAEHYGVYQSVTKTTMVKAKDGKGISIQLNPVKGQPVLNGVKVLKK